MNTYGFHTIHGRAPAIATGLKAARPDLMVWVITGDGDALSIGGNHLIHALRRNVDVRIIMFNNRIYGLTKGQASPTSELGKVTKSSPYGTIDFPVSPLAIALAAEASFIARSVDTHTEHLQRTLEAARAPTRARPSSRSSRTATSSTTAPSATSPTARSARTGCSMLEHGQPMIFGKDRDKGIRLNGHQPEVVTIGEGGVTEADLLVHDETDPLIAFMLAHLWWPDFPVPVGVVRNIAATDPRPDDHRPDRPGDRGARRGRPEEAAQHRRNLDRRVMATATDRGRRAPSRRDLPRLPLRELSGRRQSARTAARTSGTRTRPSRRRRSAAGSWGCTSTSSGRPRRS